MKRRQFCKTESQRLSSPEEKREGRERRRSQREGKLLLKIYLSHIRDATNSALTYKGPASTSDSCFNKTILACT
jgi:hypothetical protein